MGHVILNKLQKLAGRWLVLALSIPVLAALNAEASVGGADFCLTCGKELIDAAWEYPQGIVCQDCHENVEKCSICGLPTAGEKILTQDGRTICSREMGKVVVKEFAAAGIFDAVRKELTWITEDRLKLKTPEVKVRLFEVDHWNLGDKTRDGIEYRSTGFAQTLSDGKKFAHTVSILSHQLPDDVKAVAAHEYAHLWINENKSQGREIERDTGEAICELVAWKYMTLERNEEQKNVILRNQYTNGKIRELIDLEVRYGFNNILDWVKKGSGKQLTESVLREFIDPSSSLNLLVTSRPTIKKTFEKLELKGIMYSKRNPMVMINDHTLTPNESATVEVGGKPQRIRCLEIHPDRVVVLLEDTSETLVLSASE